MTNRILMSIGLALTASTLAWASSEAKIRIAHASPDTPAVDVLFDGAPEFVDVAYTTVTDYLPFAPGAYDVQFVPTGQPQPVYIEEELEFAPYLHYTVLAVGMQADIEALVLPGAILVTPSQAMVRFVHASPDAPAVDVAVAGGDTLFEDVSFKEATGYEIVDPGTYDLEVLEAGTNNVVLSVPGVMLDAGTAYTVFAMGLAGGAPALEAVLAVDLFTCIGDIIPDGEVNTLDLLLVLATWGECPDTCFADVNGDGVVDVEDLLAVLAAWGPCQ